MIFRWWGCLGLALAVIEAGCATGAGGDTYSGDDGGGITELDASTDTQPDAAGSEGASREDAGRVADATTMQEGGPEASPEAAADDAAQDSGEDASTGPDAPPDVGPADVAAPDASDGSADDGGATCNAQNCTSGCCHGNNCVNGTMDHACGTGGGACQDCAALGDTCVSGACQAQSGSCSATCAGCCDTNDACHSMASAQYCPTNNGGIFQPGGPCEDCQAEGDSHCFLDIIAYVCLP